MKSCNIMHRGFWTSTLLMCALLMCAIAGHAQEAGGDLGGSGIFRAKNPETKSGRRTNKGRPNTRVSRPPKTSSTAALTAERKERIEDAIDEGNEARDARNYADAERAYQDALKLDPRDARASQGLGNVYTDQRRWDDAEKAYRQVVISDQSNADAMVALSYVLVQPRTGGSNARRLLDAENFARRAVQLQPMNAFAHDQLGATFEARALLNKETEEEYRRAIAIDPDFAVAHVHLARLLRKTNRGKEAEPLYVRARELAKDAPTLVLIADALQSEQRWDDSEPVLRRALELDARNPNALFLLGKALVVKRRYNDAVPLLKSAVEVSPRSFQLYNLLGRSFLGMERYEDAEQTYIRAAQFASPSDRTQLAGAFGLAGVGDGFMKAGRASDALRAYQHALKLDPNNAELQNKLAEARARLNK